jgi:hypothetical protein
MAAGIGSSTWVAPDSDGFDDLARSTIGAAGDHFVSLILW